MGLEQMYGRHGGRVSGRVKFVDEYAPSGWDGKSRPDVAMMTLPTSLRAWEKQYSSSRETFVGKVSYSKDWDAMDAKTEKALAARARKEGGAQSLGDAFGSSK